MIFIPDEMLMAYADGELRLEEQQALEQLLRQDPQLCARLEPFVETRMRLGTAFDQTLREPVPQRLLDAVRHRSMLPPAWSAAPPLSIADRIRNALAAVRVAVTPSGFGPTPAFTASMAVVLFVVGAAAGWMAGRATSERPLIAASGPDLVATGALAKVLEKSPSRSLANPAARGAAAVPVLSFKSADNRICREYRARSGEATRDFAGLACRGTHGVWHIALHVETPKQTTPGGDYETASGASVPAVDALVESMMAGEAFGAEDEKAFLKNGWQSPKG